MEPVNTPVYASPSGPLDPVASVSFSVPLSGYQFQTLKSESQGALADSVFHEVYPEAHMAGSGAPELISCSGSEVTGPGPSNLFGSGDPSTLLSLMNFLNVIMRQVTLIMARETPPTLDMA